MSDRDSGRRSPPSRNRQPRSSKGFNHAQQRNPIHSGTRWRPSESPSRTCIGHGDRRRRRLCPGSAPASDADTSGATDPISAALANLVAVAAANIGGVLVVTPKIIAAGEMGEAVISGPVKVQRQRHAAALGGPLKAVDGQHATWSPRPTAPPTSASAVALEAITANADDGRRPVRRRIVLQQGRSSRADRQPRQRHRRPRRRAGHPGGHERQRRPRHRRRRNAHPGRAHLRRPAASP